MNTISSSSRRADLITLLRKSQWEILGRGRAGEMWTDPANDAQVGIPYELSEDDRLWNSVIERVAHAQKTTVGDLDSRVTNLRYDVTEFKVDGPSWEHSVPVEAGFNLFKTARQILRASATTARNPKVTIGGGYSKTGDEVLDRSRFGQTREGSYVVPLMVPIIDRPVESAADTELNQLDEDQVFDQTKVEKESDERRATRTMAESLLAVNHAIVQRDQIPTETQVFDLAQAGVSRELLNSLVEVIRQPSVRSFDTVFHWSEMLMNPTNISSNVSIPSEAQVLLKESAQRFKRPSKRTVETFTGPIVQLRDEPLLAHGQAAIDTSRNGRAVELHIHVPEDKLEEVHSWFKDRETVRVQGVVRRAAGRLIIDKPKQLELLADTLLFDDPSRS